MVAEWMDGCPFVRHCHSHSFTSYFAHIHSCAHPHRTLPSRRTSPLAVAISRFGRGEAVAGCCGSAAEVTLAFLCTVLAFAGSTFLGLMSPNQPLLQRCTSRLLLTVLLNPLYSSNGGSSHMHRESSMSIATDHSAKLILHWQRVEHNRYTQREREREGQKATCAMTNDQMIWPFFWLINELAVVQRCAQAGKAMPRNGTDEWKHRWREQPQRERTQHR